jgi:hypothetical protein
MLRITHVALGAAAAVALAAGAAQAQVVITQPVQTQTVVTTRAPLTLTPTQRQVIYRNVVRERVVQQAPATVGAAPVVEYRVGARVPTGVTLYDVPQTVVTEVPAVSSYRYMVVNNRAWLVDPTTSEIVAEVAE